MNHTTVVYPAGSFVRVKQIVGDRKAGIPGLLPIGERTWLKLVEDGRAPPGQKLGPRTTVWRVEDVLALARPTEVKVVAPAPGRSAEVKAA